MFPKFTNRFLTWSFPKAPPVSFLFVVFETVPFSRLAFVEFRFLYTSRRSEDRRWHSPVVCFLSLTVPANLENVPASHNVRLYSPVSSVPASSFSLLSIRARQSLSTRPYSPTWNAPSCHIHSHNIRLYSPASIMSISLWPPTSTRNTPLTVIASICTRQFLSVHSFCPVAALA